MGGWSLLWAWCRVLMISQGRVEQRPAKKCFVDGDQGDKEVLVLQILAGKVVC